MASANDIKMRILAEDKTAAAFRSAKKNIDATEKSMRLLKAAISIGAVTAFVGMTKRMAEAADQTAKFSQRIGINAEAFQELQYAATQSGIKTEQFNMALQRFTRRSAEAAEGTGEAKAALRQLGVQLTDSNGKLRPAEDLLGDVAEAFKNIEDPAQRVRLAFKLFDSEGVSMVQMLGQGRDAMFAMRKEAQQLGIVMDQDTLKNAELVSNQFDIMGRVISTNLTTALVELGPVLVDLTKFIADIARGLSDFIANFREIEDLSLNQVNMQIEELEKKLSVFQELSDTIGKSGGDVSGYALQIKQVKEELNKLYDAQQKLGGGQPIVMMPEMNIQANGMPSFFDEFSAGTKKGFDDYRDNLNDTMEATRKATEKAFKGMEDALVDFAMTGKLNFRDLANSIVADLIRIQIRAAMSNVFSAIGGDLFGSLFSSTPSTGTAGTRASGGPVGAGRSYLVGENGPELLTMGSSSGYVTPSAASAGGPITINYNIQSWDSRDTMDAIQKSAPQIVGIVQNAFNKRGRRGPMG